MNIDEIESLWRSPHNQPSQAALKEHQMKLVSGLQRRHRASRGLLFLTMLPLIFITAKIALHVAQPDPAHTAVDLGREWGILPLLALPWVGWFLMLGLYLRQQKRHPNYDQSINASLGASLDENRTERARYKLIAGVLLASIPLMALIVHQLRAVGKAGDEILLPAYIIWPAYVALLVGWFGWHYRRRLLPRKRQLESLLQSYK